MYATQNVAKQSQDSKAAFVVLWHADDKLFISGQVCTGEQQGIPANSHALGVSLTPAG